mmetsp:Transcript_12088/g.20770  ORF Transcript_12088/g.20770 Transcript_12088/m.20770 type:complete len:235 (+) Transcript_12088:127-831(+)
MGHNGHPDPKVCRGEPDRSHPARLYRRQHCSHWCSIHSVWAAWTGKADALVPSPCDEWLSWLHWFLHLQELSSDLIRRSLSLSLAGEFRGVLPSAASLTSSVHVCSSHFYATDAPHPGESFPTLSISEKAGWTRMSTGAALSVLPGGEFGKDRYGGLDGAGLDISSSGKQQSLVSLDFQSPGDGRLEFRLGEHGVARSHCDDECSLHDDWRAGHFWKVSNRTTRQSESGCDGGL